MNELGAQTVVDAPTLVDYRTGQSEPSLSAALHQFAGIGQGTHTALQVPPRIIMGTPYEAPAPSSGWDLALLWTHAVLSVVSMIFGASMTYVWMSL